MNTQNKYSLTQGGILAKLLLVALPIIGTQVVQMVYNLTDMFWLGRLGSNAVAASGTAGMFLWLAVAFIAFGSKGAEIGVSQNLGRKDTATAKTYAQASVSIGLILGAAYGLILFLLRGPLLSFFNIREASVVAGAETYLAIVALGLPFNFIAAAATGVYIGSGNARTPFYINALGLAINMILDPVLIFNFNMGIAGAAVATTLAQVVVGLLMLVALAQYMRAGFGTARVFALPRLPQIRQVVRWALPIAIEGFLFTFLTMVISRMVAAFGANALATMRVGTQAESLSWLIAGGFSSALTAYVGQNYGAGKWRRIHRGFRISTLMMVAWGALVTFGLVLGANIIFAIFLPGEPEVIAMGATFLRILAVCQLLACLEAVATGAFRGMGNTAPPSIISVTCNGLWVVAAYFLSRTGLGLHGIWWAFSVGAGVRGLWMYLWYVRASRRLPKTDVAPV